LARGVTKKRTNVSLDAGLLEEARRHQLNISSIAETALDAAVREARARDWAERNAEALAERAEWIERHGLPLAAWRSWKL
jgi:antitoxin CcdA